MITKESIEKKILSALSAAECPPNGDHKFTEWMCEVLDMDDLTFMFQWDIEDGEEVINKWFVELLVKSGRYDDCGGGFVVIAQGN